MLESSFESEVEAASTQFVGYCISYSSIALLYYDYALTLPDEVQFMWFQRFRVSTLLYICCRYSLLANVLYILAQTGNLTNGCDTWYRFIAALSVAGRSAVVFAMTTKTFAIFGRNVYILVYFLLIGLACIGLDIAHVPGVKCVGSFTNPIVNNLLGILMLLVEYSAFILVLLRSWQSFRVGGHWSRKNKGFMFLVFEHGVLYFAIVTAFTTAKVVLSFVAPNWFLQRLLNAFTLPLSCLFTARFLLHLRVWEHKRGCYANTNDIGTGLEFASGPGVTTRAIDDFGEDPMRTALTRREVI